MSNRQTARRKISPGSGLTSRYRALLLTHRSLEEKLTAEMRRPRPDAAVVRRIKRRKLSLKDEMASIDRLLDTVGASFDGAPSLAGLDERSARDDLRDFRSVRWEPASNQGRYAEQPKHQSA